MNQLWEAGHPLWISRQVLREYLAVLTRPQTFSQPQPTAVRRALNDGKEVNLS